MIRDTETVRQYRIVHVVEQLAFYIAIMLPFVYVPLLLIGIDEPAHQLLFITLVALNVVVLIIGHSYNPRTGEP